MASEDSLLIGESFLLIARTHCFVTACFGQVAWDTRVSQHIARFVLDRYRSRAAT